MNGNNLDDDREIIAEHVQLYRSGDPEKMQQASEFFYERLNGYVYQLAIERYPTFMASRGEELIQCAWIGILEAIDRYDPYSYAMTTHFKPYILQQMMLLIQDASSVHLAANLSRLRKAQDTDSPDAAELSRKSGLSRPRIENGLSKLYIQNTVDLDEVGGILADACPDNQPEQALLQDESKALLNAELRRTLNQSEYEYLCGRFGLFTASEGTNDAHYRAGLERKIVIQLRSSAIIRQLAN